MLANYILGGRGKAAAQWYSICWVLVQFLVFPGKKDQAADDVQDLCLRSKRAAAKQNGKFRP